MCNKGCKSQTLPSEVHGLTTVSSAAQPTCHFLLYLKKKRNIADKSEISSNISFRPTLLKQLLHQLLYKQVGNNFRINENDHFHFSSLVPLELSI